LLDKPGKPLVRIDTRSSAVEGMGDPDFPNCSRASSTDNNNSSPLPNIL